MDYTEIIVDPKFHRHLIGKGGANSKYMFTCNKFKDYCRHYGIKFMHANVTYVWFFQSLVNRIKEQHKVSVRIPPDNEKSNLIRIEGDPLGVQEAKKELLELASRMASWISLYINKEDPIEQCSFCFVWGLLTFVYTGLIDFQHYAVFLACSVWLWRKDLL